MPRALASIRVRCGALAFAVGCAALLPGLASAVDAPSTAEPVPPELRIPEGSRPLRYAVTLTVSPGEAAVPGEIVIDFDLDRPHPIVWLNAVDLAVAQVSVDDAVTTARVVTNRDQFLGIAFEPALAAGRHRLKLVYSALQNRNSTRGIFTLQDADTSYTMTHFEPMAARRAFPCFDEPAFKVPWQLTLRVPRDMVAVSNTPVVAERDDEGGRKIVEFAATDPLPSYLVAFAVGHWEKVSAGTPGKRSTPMSLIAPRKKTAALAFGAQAFPELFALEERWFGIDYPFAKLDHIAIPLGVRFAMENAGLITYGAPILLQPAAPTPAFRHSVANIGAHEIAHQWFGNLVTMQWWDDIWLNEAFATWFAEKIVDAWRPAYERGAGRVQARADAMETDRLVSARRIREPIVTRGDIFNAFDSITYEKGATVIGMFEGWVGDELFQRGVRSYLEAHRYGSATVRDFLDALGAASAQPVARAFSTFLDQNGVPEVGVTLECSSRGARLALSQRRLSTSNASVADQQWQIPVCARYGAGQATRTSCTLLTERQGSLDLQPACPTFVVANAGGRGYYVPAYSPDLLARLAKSRARLTSAEYASVLYDLRPLVRASAVSSTQALAWIHASARSRDRHVMLAAITLASFVRDELVSDDQRARFAAYVRREFGPRARALGFTPRPGESDDDQLLRRSILAFVAPEDPALASQARRLARAWIADRNAIDPGLADTVLLVAARSGDAALFDDLLGALRMSTDRLDRRNLLIALYSFGDPALARRGLSLLLDEQVDIRDATTALSLAVGRAPPSRVPHAFITDNFDALAARVDADAPGRWPGYAEALCSEADRASVEAFWRDRVGKYAGADYNLNQALEVIGSCTALRDRERARVTAFLSRY